MALQVAWLLALFWEESPYSAIAFLNYFHVPRTKL